MKSSMETNRLSYSCSQQSTQNTSVTCYMSRVYIFERRYIIFAEFLMLSADMSNGEFFVMINPLRSSILHIMAIMKVLFSTEEKGELK